MVRCYIDGQEAIPKLTDTIKVTRQNFYIKDTESYTYDVTFPMSLAQNRRVLGNLQRMEVSKTAVKFASCQLVADNITVISGGGTVTSVTDEEVKLQIKTQSADDDDGAIGGRYPEEFYTHTTSECLAAVDWQYTGITAPFPTDSDDPTVCLRLPSLKLTGNAAASSRTPDGSLTLYTPTIASAISAGYIGAKGVCVLPLLYNASADKFYNVLGRTVTYNINSGGSTTKWETYTDEEALFNPLPCFALTWAVRQMAGVAGYTATGGFFADELASKLYIARPTRYPYTTNDLAHWRRLSSYVPRWKLSTLLNELANLFNLAYTFDTTAKTVRVEFAARLSSSTSASDAYTAFEPLDEFSTEYDEDGAEYIAATNIAYDIDNDNSTRYFHTLTDELRESFPVAEYADTLRLKLAFHATAEATRRQTLYHCPTGYYFAYVDPGTDGDTSSPVQCARFAPIIRDADSDTKTTLRIIPAPWSVADAPSYTHTATLQHGLADCVQATRPMGVVTLTEEETDTETTATVQSVMEGEADAPSEQGESTDGLTLFIFEPEGLEATPTATSAVEHGYGYESGVKLAGYPSAIHLAGCAHVDGDLYAEGSHADYTEAQLARIGRCSLALTSTPCELYVGLCHAATRGAETEALVDTHTKVCIKFLADELPVATRPYVFHGKKYIAEKIELEIKDGRVQPVKTGYFYEMKQTT